jgi:hypothetical protein
MCCVHLIDGLTCNELPMNTYKLAIQGTLTMCWIYGEDQSAKSKRISKSERIVPNVYEYDGTLRFIDKHNYYNEEVMSVGTHLNLCCIHDLIIPFWFYFYWLQAAYFADTYPLVCLNVIFLVIKPLVIQKSNWNSTNKINAATMKF